MKDPVDYLAKQFDKRRQRNPAYSLRAFARDMAISPARLSQVLSRKRPLTRGQVDKIAAALELRPSEAVKLARAATRATGKTTSYDEVSLDVLRVIAEWHHAGILCLLETKPAGPHSIAWIARRLGISAVKARGAVELLVKLSLLARHGDRLRPTSKHLATPSDIPSAALRKLHCQLIDLGKASLARQAIVDRDITSITMGVDKSKLPQAKILIREFRRSLCALLESSSATEVYALNVQLFQLSK